MTNDSDSPAAISEAMLNAPATYQAPIYRCALVKEGSIETSAYRTSQDIAETARKILADSDREVFLVFLLDTRNRLIGVNVASVGTLTASLVHPREVFKPAIASSSSAIVTVQPPERRSHAQPRGCGDHSPALGRGENPRHPVPRPRGDRGSGKALQLLRQRRDAPGLRTRFRFWPPRRDHHRSPGWDCEETPSRPSRGFLPWEARPAGGSSGDSKDWPHGRR